MATTTTCRALLLLVVVLTAQLRECMAHVGVGDGFSVELIHRDSIKSPYHDPSLTAHGRVLAAVRRSTARAAALARSYVGNGAVSNIVSTPYEYLMAVNVGTPPTRLLAVVDTGSSLVWFNCKPHSVAALPSTVFDPSSSSTFAHVGCNSDTCHALQAHGTSCDASSNCVYHYGYGDGTRISGLLSTETFTFDTVPGGCPGCRDHPKVVVPNVSFGCSTSTNRSRFVGDGIVGLDAGEISLITQLGAGTTFGRRFSYCLPPYSSKNVSTMLNFGDRAVVKEPGAATTALIRSDREGIYTVMLESVKIGNDSYEHLSHVIFDSGTPLTFLDKALLDPIVGELSQLIGLPKATPPEKILQLCYDVSSTAQKLSFLEHVPDVTLYLAVFGEKMTLKAENTFLEVQEGTMCLVMTPTTAEQPLQIIGNFAQQNMHIGYDLDKATVTFAPADCASSYNSPPVMG